MPDVTAPARSRPALLKAGRLVGLACSLMPKARRHWQPVMAGFIVTEALCLFGILVRIDAEGGAGLKSWDGVLNFTFPQFYCFVILGVQFRHALETHEQSAFLISRGCVLQQGFLFARPVSQAEFEPMLKTGTTRPAEAAAPA